MSKFDWYILLTFIISFVVTFFIVRNLIPFLNKKNHHQPILEEVKLHESKKNTPTMGGIGIIIGTVVGILGCLFFALNFSNLNSIQKNEYVLVTVIVLVVFLVYGLLGFLDDYLKVFKKHNEGLNKPLKLFVLFLGSIFFLIISIIFTDITTSILIPFTDIRIELGIFYYPFVVFCFMAVTNGVNFTDGMDGLLSSVTIYFSLFFVVITCILRQSVFYAYPICSVFVSLIGALFAFLIFNKFPAKIFMGDTGSLAIAGLIISSLLLVDLEFYLPIVGIIYVIEVLSVGIQIFYFKATKGKRFFKMAPFHHHLELLGHKEKNIVLVFSGITFLVAIITFIIYLYTYNF